MTDSNQQKWKASAEEAKRKIILDAALQVFGTRGFVEPTMDDIAVEAQYSRRSLYRYFPTKEALGISLSFRCCSNLVSFLQPVESKSLFDIFWAYFQFSRTNPFEFRVILETRHLNPFDQSGEINSTHISELEVMINLLRSQFGPVRGEPMAAALGYVEFLFRYQEFWNQTGMAGDDKAVRTVLLKILKE